MVARILKCKSCKIYSLNETCSSCGKRNEEVKPPKYSPDDKYAHYRREYKEQMAEK